MTAPSAESGAQAGRGAPEGREAGSGTGREAGSGTGREAGSGTGSGSSFVEMWRELAPIGRHADSGGYRRYAWTGADADCRAWFRAQAESRGLTHEVDRNGNQWAWHGDPTGRDAVVTGSHLDSVPDGGAFDGPLGVVSAFAALDELRARGAEFTRPLAISNFVDEEGARFGLACVGSRLTAGRLTAEQAARLTDADGVTLPQAMERAGHDPESIGADPERLGRIGAFVELHVEQGRALAEGPHPVGVASAIWPHGRWRFDFRGEANHAGTTRLADRRDPMLTYAHTVLAAREHAARTGALATFGKVAVDPNGVNAIASLVRGWLDSRAADEETLAELVGAVERSAAEHGAADGIGVEVTRESFTPVVEFAGGLRDRLAALLARLDAERGGPGSAGTGSRGAVSRDAGAHGAGGPGAVPILPTGAGHDAGVLSSAVPTAMLYVRNPTGISHSPAEFATEDDCTAGVVALADVLEDLACR